MATRIYLVRHAAASSFSESGDAGRALTEEGRARFRALVERLGPALEVRRILSSPYLRARQTAALLSALCGVPVEEESALASGESEGPALLKLAAACGPGCALVGHNPEIGHAMALAARDSLRVPPGTIVLVELEAGVARLLQRWEP